MDVSVVVEERSTRKWWDIYIHTYLRFEKNGVNEMKI